MNTPYRTSRAVGLLLSASALLACGASEGAEDATVSATMTAAPVTMAVELWNEGQPAFGVFVPNERPREEMMAPDGTRRSALYTADGAEALGANPLLDYVFLNLEPSWDVDAVRALSEGLGRVPEGRTTLLVRIPPISTDGAEEARTRILQAFENGADGIVVPHVRSPEEAELAIGFFEEAGVDVWTPSNPTGDKIAMLMIEDPGALATAQEIAELDGYSVLACGIGSLTRAMDGDREAAEAGNLEVLAQATANGKPDMITANADDVARRIEEGFLGLLMGGSGADEAIRIGRAAAGR